MYIQIVHFCFHHKICGRFDQEMMVVATAAVSGHFDAFRRCYDRVLGQYGSHDNEEKVRSAQTAAGSFA
jgi:hypothetical protein